MQSSVRNKMLAAAGAGVLALASAMLPSPDGLDSIKKHEGAAPVAYLDAVQVPTICYGSTRDVRLGTRATPAECEERLRVDTTYAGRGVARSVRVRITQGQYDALVSFVFNVGESKFAKSTMLAKMNAGDCYGAAREFDRWVYARGKRLNGLVSRRADERRRWEEGCTLWR